MTDELMNRSVKEDDRRRPDGGLGRARTELKRAYVQLGFGQFDEALESCSRAEALLDDHFLPSTLRAAVLSASGRHTEAISALKSVRDKYPRQALPHLYFAEACYFTGRVRQAERALDCAQTCEMSKEEGAFFERLRAVWEHIEPSDVPPPLEPAL